MRISESRIRQIIREEAQRALRESFHGGDSNYKRPRWATTWSSLSQVAGALRAAGNKELADIVSRASSDPHAKVTLQPVDPNYERFNIYLGDNTDTWPVNGGKGFVHAEELENVGVHIRRSRD